MGLELVFFSFCFLMAIVTMIVWLFKKEKVALIGFVLYIVFWLLTIISINNLGNNIEKRLEALEQKPAITIIAPENSEDID